MKKMIDNSTYKDTPRLLPCNGDQTLQHTCYRLYSAYFASLPETYILQSAMYPLNPSKTVKDTRN